MTNVFKLMAKGIYFYWTKRISWSCIKKENSLCEILSAQVLFSSFLAFMFLVSVQMQWTILFFSLANKVSVWLDASVFKHTPRHLTHKLRKAPRPMQCRQTHFLTSAFCLQFTSCPVSTTVANRLVIHISADFHSHAKVTFAFRMDFFLHYFTGKQGPCLSSCRYIG